jgi:archaellum biogenesis ATPase FlaH
MHYEIEKRLLTACVKSRPAFEEVFSRISPQQMSEVGSLVGELISDFYTVDKDAKEIDKGVLIHRVESSRGSAATTDAILDYLGSLSSDVSIPNLLEDIRKYRQQKLGDEIVMNLVNQVDSKIILEKMIEYQDIGLENPEEDEQVFKEFKIADLVKNSYTKENLIKVFPKELNDRIDGGCRPGHHVVVYARPEVGKTLFVINMTAGFLLHNHRVLYVGNEDPASDILMRIVSRLSKMNKQQIMENPDEAEQRAFERGYRNLVVAGLSPGNFFEIRKLVEKYDPKVVILDQLRNIDVASESRVQGLEKAATEARNLAKRYGLVVVSVTQAGESAEGKAILDRSDIDFSKTGIPATADLMVGIGADASMEKYGLRTISLPKNKLSGNHDHFTVQINPQLGTVEAT